MDQSLDDIISANKGKFSLRRGKRGGSGGGARGTRGAGAKFGARRGRGRGGAGSGRGSPRGGVQKRRPMGYNRGPMPDVWSHDKFNEMTTRGPQSGGARGGMGKLHISNLDFGVNDSDINELFAEFGPMKKAAVHYDKSGRSLGTAEVWYERQSDAAKAVKQYNGVPLDGRPMNIQLVGGVAAASAIPASKRIGGARGGRGGGGSGRTAARGAGGNRGGRGGRGRGGGRGPPPSADDLDAELDAYRNKMDTA